MSWIGRGRIILMYLCVRAFLRTIVAIDISFHPQMRDAAFQMLSVEWVDVRPGP